MSEHETTKKHASDFEAAHAIVEILQNRDKPEQERIHRWVAESLQLSTVVARSAAVAGAPTIPPVLTESPSTARGTDIKSFVENKQPKSDVQFATVAAYYFRFEAKDSGRKDAISADDLQEAARLSGWKRFAKPYVPLQNAANQGYLDRAQRGTFQINAVGENLVAMTLPGGTTEPGSPRPVRNGRRPRLSKPKQRAKSSRERKSK